MDDEDKDRIIEEIQTFRSKVRLKTGMYMAARVFQTVKGYKVLIGYAFHTEGDETLGSLFKPKKGLWPEEKELDELIRCLSDAKKVIAEHKKEKLEIKTIGKEELSTKAIRVDQFGEEIKDENGDD